MARAGLGLGVRELSKLANVSTNTLTRLEAGGMTFLKTQLVIRTALEQAGVDFIAENGGGAGVRLRK